MRCLAIDDEPLALAQLESYISQVPFLQLVRLCRDAYEAISALGEEEIDLLFIDINMPDLSGMDLLRSLLVRPLVVFTTAYPEYAIEGYKMDAVDYLLKPFDFQEFLRAADKAHKQWEYRLRETQEGEDAVSPEQEFLFIKSGYKMIRVNVADIRYIEAKNEYVHLFVEGDPDPITSLISMKSLEEQLPESHFMRVHRSFIVNLSRILEISRFRIVFDSNIYIPIGENYKEKFMAYINRRCIGK
ncbi:MAG: LytTR family DNA-binding domain-containing protein [Bacteroides sp.]|nr:LytTR family DNA-binding domain-containing protein [Bacteroides sp.]